MYSVARRLNSPGDQLEALQKLIGLGPYNAVKHYFSVHQQLSDSVQTARNAAKNQFALIRYEAKKFEADNLRLQKANTEKEYQVIGAMALLIAVSISFVFWYRKRKQRMRLEAQNAIRENQLRISKRVHDVVANGLYRMMSEIENGGDVDKGLLLDKIEDMYERSRDLSYEKATFSNQDFHETIAQLVKSFATKITKVLVQGNSKNLWQNTSENTRQEVGHILQELMVNMRKHSKASNVLVKFGHYDNRINIIYSDDGIGFPEEFKYGNGLQNTGNRIKGIEGTITFDKNPGNGIRITISFPVYLKDQACSKVY
jgi:signal transduction histidine kinase